MLAGQRPGSAKRFITIEGEPHRQSRGVDPRIQKYRAAILGANMIAVRGCIQREGDVVHLVAHTVADLSGKLAGWVAKTCRSPCGMAAAMSSPMAAAEGIRATRDRGTSTYQIYISTACG